MHINHLINIYALTGLGNFDLATGNFSAPTRFLVMNTGRNIRVFSTAEIIQDVLNGGTTYLFGKKKSRRKNTRDMITLKKIK